MSQSVSLILPVCQEQLGLRDRVLNFAEVLSDLATRFEILIVGYGLTETAQDWAVELAREYPQIRFLTPQDAQDFLQAIHYGIGNSDGQIIFIHDSRLPFSPSLLRSLWEMRDDDELVMAQSPAGIRTRVGSADSTAAEAPHAHLGSLQMLRRSALRALSESPSRPRPAVQRLTRTDLIREAEAACPQPNLVSKLRRLVFG